MSEQHPTGEEIARMLREQGPVEAPPDLADEVMRQVHAEPVARPKRRIRFHIPRPAVLAPALGLAAAAGVVAAIVLSGGPGTSSSAESSAGAGGGTAAGSPRSAVAAPSHTEMSRYGALSGNVGRFRITRAAAGGLSGLGVVRPGATKLSQSANPMTDRNVPYTLLVSGAQWRQALTRLRALSADQRRHSDEPTVVVILRRKH